VWREIAAGLFAGAGENLEREDRMQLVLRSGLQRLGLGYGIIMINDGERCRVEAVAAAGNVAPEWFRAGREISPALTYCGLLGANRESLAIEYASLSEWRAHPAHRELGWETYIGTRRILASEKFLAVSFFDRRGREQIYSAEEKAFVGQLASWITAIYEAGEHECGAAYQAGAGEPRIASPPQKVLH
jgi:hypothetical protein